MLRRTGPVWSVSAPVWSVSTLAQRRAGPGFEGTARWLQTGQAGGPLCLPLPLRPVRRRVYRAAHDFLRFAGIGFCAGLAPELARLSGR